LPLPIQSGLTVKVAVASLSSLTTMFRCDHVELFPELLMVHEPRDVRVPLIPFKLRYFGTASNSIRPAKIVTQWT
jgi:hypothetical protein